MKICPKCNRQYADKTYDFCLEDGTLLSSRYDPNATIIDSDVTFYDPQATAVLPPSPDNYPPAIVTVPFIAAPTQPDIVQRLLIHLTDKNQKFSIIGRFMFNNEYIWTNGHFFEIAESIPTVLADLFPPNEGSAPAELVKNLQNQLATYTKIQVDIPAKKEGMTDLISDTNVVCVNDVYYQYLQMRYPTASVMLGKSDYNPALFVAENKIRAGIMGVKI